MQTTRDYYGRFLGLPIDHPDHPDQADQADHQIQDGELDGDVPCQIAGDQDRTSQETWQ